MKYILTLILSLVLIGCESNYEEEGSHAGELYEEDYPAGGYSHVRLSDNGYMVTFRGNGYTSSDMARDYALLRVAEICLESTKPFFEILEYKLIYLEQVVLNDKPVATYRINCLDTDKDNALVHDAVITYKTITTMYGLKD